MEKKYTKKAVALKYDRKLGDAPKVTAKGKGKVARNIIDLARKHDIPIKDDPDLIEILSSLDIDEEIPSEIYVAVAELLAFVYSMNSKKGSLKLFLIRFFRVLSFRSGDVSTSYQFVTVRAYHIEFVDLTPEQLLITKWTKIIY